MLFDIAVVGPVSGKIQHAVPDVGQSLLAVHVRLAKEKPRNGRANRTESQQHREHARQPDFQTPVFHFRPLLFTVSFAIMSKKSRSVKIFSKNFTDSHFIGTACDIMEAIQTQKGESL